ncbi:hypothetical protein ACOME3_009718 [Neoechinorhynchus agilis]
MTPSSYMQLKFSNSDIDISDVASKFVKLTNLLISASTVRISSRSQFGKDISLITFNQCNIQTYQNLFGNLQVDNKRAEIEVHSNLNGTTPKLKDMEFLNSKFPQYMTLSEFELTPAPSGKTLYRMHKHFEKLELKYGSVCWPCIDNSWLQASLVNPKWIAICVKYGSGPTLVSEECNKAILDGVTSVFSKLDTITIDSLRYRLEEDAEFPSSLKHLELRGSEDSIRDIINLLATAINRTSLRTLTIRQMHSQFTLNMLEKLPRGLYSTRFIDCIGLDPYADLNPETLSLLARIPVKVESSHFECDCEKGSHLIDAMTHNNKLEIKCLDHNSREVVDFDAIYCGAKPQPRTGSPKYILAPILIMIITLIVIGLIIFCLQRKRRLAQENAGPNLIKANDYEESTLFGSALSLVFPSGGPGE